MKSSYNINTLARLFLFAAAIIWGSSFIVVKNTVDVFPPFMLLGFRFTLGCALLCVVFHKKLKQLNKDYFIKGAVVGACLFGAFGLQTIGITYTTPGKNAFLTAVYCVIVPFLFWIVDKCKPDVYNFLAALLCILGIGLVSLNGELSVGIGDALTLASGFFFAAHMVSIAKFSQGKDPVLITILQFGFCAAFSWITGFLFEDFPVQWSVGTVGGLLYLAVFSTAVALLLQNVGQKHTPPASASIILSLESVFGVLFSVVLYGEEVTPRLLFGFVLIFFAVVVSETKLSFLAKKELLPQEASVETYSIPENY